MLNVAGEASREKALRERDRAKVLAARSARRPLGLMLLLAGPGILVMIGENDGPSMLSYAATGARYGIGFFVPFILLTFLMAYVVQEMTVRVGIATGRGHAELIDDRFGPLWGRFSLVDLFVGNLLTLVAEFVAIRAGAAYFGIAPDIAVGGAAALVIAAYATRRYASWERLLIALAVGNLFFVPAALLAHPDPGAIARAIGTWGPLPGGANAAFLTLVLANVGATVTPWMIFFQQSAVVDKGLTRADVKQGRLDTALGAILAAVVAIATVVAASPLFVHHVDASSLASGADFATALRPYIGGTGAAFFALGMVEAGIVAAATIATSSAYAVGEIARSEKSLNAGFARAAKFYGTSAVSILVAAGVVLIPGAPLLAITITVNVIATLLMAPSLLLLLLLSSDREIMGDLVNSVRANVVAGTVAVTIASLGSLYGAITVVQLFGGWK